MTSRSPTTARRTVIFALLAPCVVGAGWLLHLASQRRAANMQSIAVMNAGVALGAYVEAHNAFPTSWQPALPDATEQAAPSISDTISADWSLDLDAVRSLMDSSDDPRMADFYNSPEAPPIWVLRYTDPPCDMHHSEVMHNRILRRHLARALHAGDRE